MIHRHIWKVIDRVEHPSAWEQMTDSGKRKPTIEASDLLSFYQRDVIVTRKCEVCGTDRSNASKNIVPVPPPKRARGRGVLI